MLKKFSFYIIPTEIFLFFFWFKNGFIDKVCGILLGIVSPATAYHGDTWAGWKEYIVGTWDKNQVAHVVLSPLYNVLFPILIVLQCLPFIFAIFSVCKAEFLTGKERPWLMRSAVSSLVVTSVMVFSQTLSGASDGEYLWHLLGFGMVMILYIKAQEKI